MSRHSLLAPRALLDHVIRPHQDGSRIIVLGGVIYRAAARHKVERNYDFHPISVSLSGGSFHVSFFLVLAASQHSGTVDEDKEDEEEGETRCPVCDKPFQDIEL